MKTICIAMNDDGTVMVGELPEQEDTSYLQPADNLDAAFAQAKEMLVGDSEQMAEKDGEAAMDRGFMKAGGPMMGGME